ncbi:MAG TPA: serine/threonine-protein kinase [Anaerolineales bacterium]|nr:serine/threonine-protein kinase [Anaerolineales bacterium]
MPLETQHIIDPDEDEDLKPHTQQLQPGSTLENRYLIQGVLGVGGMGAVYRARDLHFPNVAKLVAVKEMIIQARDPLVRSTIVRNFEREANLLATLDHPAIPRIYDYFTHNERSYLVLEYIKGKDLEVILQESEGFVPEQRAIQWAIELCDVLHYLHDHNPEPIIFRDMKPSNVMINAHDHVVLIDFGIAKPFQDNQKGTMIGTEGYSPPEQYRGEASHLADIYALGATLHHLLTRRDPRLEPPFSFGERLIHEINPRVTSDLERVIFKALQYTPADRYQSALEMKIALLDAAHQTGVLSPARVTSLKSSVQEVKPVWEFTCEDEIRGTPVYYSGAVFVGSYDNNLYALNAANGAFVWKYPTDAGIVSTPAVYENNVYFGSEDRRLHVVAARSGQIYWTYYTEGSVRSSPHIAEGHVFIGSDDGQLHAVNSFTGRSAWILDAGAPVRSTPLVHQDLVYFGSESGDFFCANFKGQIKWRFKAKRAITASPVISEGVLYIGSVDSTLYALDARTGWVIWRFRLGKPTISTPVVIDDMIFTGASDGQIYAIDSKSAREIWTYATEHQVTGSPVVAQDSLYCGSVDGCLYCLEYRTGRLRWKFRTEGPITGTPLVAKDLVYIGSTDHRLYALHV